MNKYKPEYLGKVIPADDQTKMTDFVQNKFEAFSEIYDSCKDDSEKISDISVVESEGSDPSQLSVKIIAEEEVVNNISERVKENEDVNMKDAIITARK